MGRKRRGPGPPRRNRQTGKALLRLMGDRGQILFPDGGARPLTLRVRRFQNKPGDGHGSHHQGRHKLG